MPVNNDVNRFVYIDQFVARGGGGAGMLVNAGVAVEVDGNVPDGAPALAAKILRAPKGVDTQSVPKKDHTVHDYLLYKIKGDIGIEIEVEGVDLPNIDTKTWRTKEDGSLRGGLEYVLSSPVKVTQIQDVLTSLTNTLFEKKSKPEFSFRTSVHIHVSVLDMYLEEMKTFIYLSHLFENPLVTYCGDSRIGNRFCLRTQDAESHISSIKEVLKYRGVRILSKEYEKYAAINLCSLYQYGSLEFRSMRGTLDKDVLIPWVEVLYQIREFSKGKTVTDIRDLYVSDAEGLAKEVFGNYYNKFLYEDFFKDVHRSFLLLIEIPYINRNGDV